MSPGLRVGMSCCSAQALEAAAVDGAVEDVRRAQPVRAQAGQEGHGAPVAMGRVAFEAFALLRPSPQRGHVGLDPGLVHEHQTVRVELTLERLPPRPLAGDRRPRLFKREQSFIEAQTLAPEKAPDRVPAYRDPRCSRPIPKPVDRQMRRLTDQRMNKLPVRLPAPCCPSPGSAPPISAPRKR